MVSDDEKVVKIAQFQKIARDDKKQKARKEKEVMAAANRIRFGRPGHEKKRTKLLNDKATKSHDGMRLKRRPSVVKDDSSSDV
jgi:hypothetical protein